MDIGAVNVIIAWSSRATRFPNFRASYRYDYRTRIIIIHGYSDYAVKTILCYLIAVDIDCD